ncbi:heavy-metal-associated domain-containing protein [Formosa haliotis]|uniref:heavy-metal-associated domain-containing protein n=1 Tax=Formosa haliotis TaxID=1555194 RepID=UPI000824BFC7|nr:heavy-metal-associated domain-containing protein [Formosa haliotis]
MGRSINIITVLFSIIVLFIVSKVNAQEEYGVKQKNKSIVIQVMGNCGMCKSRIEKASIKVKGVKYASWDIPSKELSLVIDERKCSPIDIKKAIAAVGHDTDLEIARDAVYNELPPCCKFRDPNSIKLDHGSGH